MRTSEIFDFLSEQPEILYYHTVFCGYQSFLKGQYHGYMNY